MFLVFRMCLDVLTAGQTLQTRKSNAEAEGNTPSALPQAWPVF